jgi:hypothetical protein
MNTRVLFVLSSLSACGAAGASRPPPATTTAAPTPAPGAPCGEPERRQLDFWIGDWDVAVRSRKDPSSDVWGEARGTNTVRSIFGGCAVEESFHADGPGAPWAGRSFSTYVPAASTWRQTWVDDSGSYLAFKGGPEDGGFALYGEPRETAGKRTQMRMVFREITRDSFLWTWERGTDPATGWTPMMTIRYVRRAAPAPSK